MKNPALYGLGLLCFLLGSCNPDYSPKPRGYFKIDLPQKEYQLYNGDCPYTFEYPVYAQVLPDTKEDAKPCWLDVSFPRFNGKIHLSYQPIISQDEFNMLVEDARTFAFKHTIKATAIDEGIISYPERDIYGIYYSIDGNTASSIQFFLTDSIRNYIRGALYFDEKPQLDSIQPVLDFIKEDINVMIQTFKWKK
jgi:gliding motility-associated lipoprotein GldD